MAPQCLELDPFGRVWHVAFLIKCHQFAAADLAVPDGRVARHLIGDDDIGLALEQLTHEVVVMDCLQVELHVGMRL